MSERFMLFLVAIVWIVVLALVNLAFIQDARAHHKLDITINHEYPAPPPVDPEPTTKLLTVSEGVSDAELSQGISLAAASGAHQFDFSYSSGFQTSIAGAWYDDQDAVSFGIARRWDKFGKVLFHGSYGQNGSDELIVIGGTWRW